MVQIYLKLSVVTKQLTWQTTSLSPSEGLRIFYSFLSRAHSSLIPTLDTLYNTEMVLCFTRKQASVSLLSQQGLQTDGV